MRISRLLYLFFFLVIVFLVMNTGVFSDDFDAMASAKEAGLRKCLIPLGNLYYIDTPVMYYSHYLSYYFFSLTDQRAVNAFKIAYVFLTFFLIAQFFKLYMDEPSAILTSFLFVFFPSHDSTVYMFMNQYLAISFALYLYAFYLASRDKLPFAFLSALAASFVSYGSTPVAIALCALFCFGREFKKAFVMLAPNVLYAVYFIYLTVVRGVGHPRTLEALNLPSIGKQYLLQVLTFLDATVGPSMWLKIYYAFFQMTAQSLILGAVVAVVCYAIVARSAVRYDRRLGSALLIVTALSFAIFSLTGRYPQICFNLGNRVTIFGSLFLAYAMIALPIPAKAKAALYALIIFTVVGVSDHWKSWNVHQQKVIAAMKDNNDLRGCRGDRPVYFSGNQYSTYGPVSNIEFLSEGWVPLCIYRSLFGKSIVAYPLNRRFVYADGYMTDTKYGTREEVRGAIQVYDSENNRFFALKADDINAYIGSLPVDDRHWIQMRGFRKVKDLAVGLMPRLQYLR